MALFFTQLMNGIQNGAIYASLAIALVLIFRTTGILNFAQGEMALFSTYLVWKFTDVGHRRCGSRSSLAMAVSFVGGALIERVVIRPVEHSSPLVIVIVTIGLFLALNSLAQFVFGSEQQAAAARLPAPRLAARAACRSRPTRSCSSRVLAVECVLAVPVAAAHEARASRSAAWRRNPESSRLLGVPVGRDAHGRLGPGGGGRRARPARWSSRPRPGWCRRRCRRSSCSRSRPPRSAGSTACSARWSAG